MEEKRDARENQIFIALVVCLLYFALNYFNLPDHEHPTPLNLFILIVLTIFLIILLNKRKIFELLGLKENKKTLKQTKLDKYLTKY